jgi:NitT/TauT family transport system permease protein
MSADLDADKAMAALADGPIGADDSPPPTLYKPPFQWSSVIGPIIVGFLFIGAWYLLAYNLDNNFTPSGKPILVPPPHRLLDDVQVSNCPGTLSYFLNGSLPAGAQPIPGCINSSKIVQATIITLKTAITGLVLSIIIGMLLATVMSSARWLERSLWPYLIALQAIPIVAITPVVIKTLGANFQARILTTVIISIFPIVKNTLFGLLSAEQNQHDLFTLSQASWFTRWSKLQLPNALPAVFTGFQISAGLAVIGAVVGDFFFSRGTTGLGRLIVDFFIDNQGGVMVICAIIAALVGIAFFVVFGVLNKLAVGKWYVTTGRTGA